MPTRQSGIPLCRHTKNNGRLCQAPALIESAFCRSHQSLRRTRPNTIGAGPGLSTQVLHPLRNARSIQDALAMVLAGLASGRIHPRIAGRMLYTLQMAQKQL